MRFILSLMLLLVFGCGEFKSFDSTASVNANNSTQRTVIQQKSLQRVLLDFGSPFVGNLMTLNHYLVDKEVLTVIFSNLASQNSPAGRFGFLISDPEDSPGEILSVILQKPGGGSAVSGTCANSGCSLYLNIGADLEQKSCATDMPLWYFPAQGTYKIIATYKDQTVRSIEFKTIDPCGKFLAKNSLNFKDRVPASNKSDSINQKKKTKNIK